MKNLIGLYFVDNQQLEEYTRKMIDSKCSIFWWHQLPAGREEIIKNLEDLLNKQGYFYIYAIKNKTLYARYKIEGFLILKDPFSDDLPEDWKDCDKASEWFDKEKRKKMLEKFIEDDGEKKGKPKILFKVSQAEIINKPINLKGVRAHIHPLYKEDIDKMNGDPLYEEDTSKMNSEYINVMGKTCHFNSLKLEEYVINSFYNALKTKGFVILAGLSGTGKTKIFEEFVKCFDTKSSMLQRIFKEVMKKIAKNIPYFEKTIKEFQEKYTEDYLKNMKIVDWHDTRQGLVYDLEHGKFKDLGGIAGGSAHKFSIYKSTSSNCTKKFKNENGYCYDPELGDSLQEAFNNLKKYLIKLRDLALNSKIEEIEKLPFPKHVVKWKLAYLWNPSLILNIFRLEDLINIAKFFCLECKEFTDCQKKLKNEKNKYLKEVHDLIFTNFIYEPLVKELWEKGKFKNCFNLDDLFSILNHIFISIRPDFRDSKSLLGYYNPLTKSYEKTKLLEFIINAVKNYTMNGKKADPFFILFDEMNLARVEYYFADFLSVLECRRFKDINESKENKSFVKFLEKIGFAEEKLSENNYKFTSQSIKLHNKEINDIPQELFLPPNLYFVGTVNIDETTHMFSPKVLDRAFTIEFDVGSFNEYIKDNIKNSKNNTVAKVEKEDFTNNYSEIDTELKEKFKEDFINNGEFAVIDKGKIKEFCTENKKYTSKLEEINNLLRKYNLHFGYRVFDEIIMFLYNCKNSKYFSYKDLNEAFDLAIKMKILPKFHGTRQQLEKPILELINVLETEKSKEMDFGKIKSIPLIKDEGIEVELDDGKTINIKTPYKYTVKKLLEILYRAKTTGYAGFM
ncbi:hypothetical protein FHQ18_09590 [Deferribacter autotrophicus]|uniref:ATPase dynein-related AAA domain-containing protein n=1 Tax=Deferribacter autotrophicus TaxID=500465 RepID=A0A5A8F1M5_9BACT|nr:hypothetical protein [Deferribacter autotrophicus]KAA0257292.1 hypothetical protein FHQ18_09590 [Deferribacter autotrophicus]